MPQSDEIAFHDISDALRRCGQEHVLRFWPQLDAAQRDALLQDIGAVNLPALPQLSRLAVGDSIAASQEMSLEAPPIAEPGSEREAARERGDELLAAGKIAALTVAGGQGTRLGFDGPKGAFSISPVRNKSLFQLFAESVLATERRYQAMVPWYIMTSPANDAATRTFFEGNRFFSLDRQRVHFFQQGMMPAFDRQGRILLDQPHRLALAPDGHGGCLLAMSTRGILRDMYLRGIEHISYFQVDNPLVHALDPAFLGFHDLRRSELSSKFVPKAEDLERVGNFALQNGRLSVIEYSDLPEHLARRKDASGHRLFDAANIAIHVFSRSFVERLTRDPAAFALPWHRASKKVPFVDLETGRRVEPTEPNAIKLESFVFDALPLAERPLLVPTDRAEEFSPVKNAEGADSVATAQRDMIRRAARWIESAGGSVARGANGEPASRIEISPMFALDTEMMKDRPLPSAPRPGEDWYIA